MLDIIGSSTSQLFAVSSLNYLRTGRSLSRQASQLSMQCVYLTFFHPLSLIQNFVNKRWSIYLNLWQYCCPNSCSNTGISWLCLQAFDPKNRPSAAEVTLSVVKMIDHENPEMFRYFTLCYEPLLVIDMTAGLTSNRLQETRSEIRTRPYPRHPQLGCPGTLLHSPCNFYMNNKQQQFEL